MPVRAPSTLFISLLLMAAEGARSQAPHAPDLVGIPHFAPATAKPAASAGYVLSDGTVRIVGLKDMQGLIGDLNQLYQQTHPGTHFQYQTSDSLAAIYSLIFDATPFAPAGVLYSSNLTYTDIVHGPPFAIRIAHGSLDPAAAVSPIAIIVNRSNPVQQLTMAQVGSIFTQGMRSRVFSRWNQISAALRPNPIHPYGLPWTDHYDSEDTTFGDFFFFRKLNAAPPVDTYTVLKTYSDVVSRVGSDPDAIGVIALNRVTDAVKVVAVSETTMLRPMTGTAEEIRSGQYPLDRSLYLYVRAVTGKALDPFVREYLRLILSVEGQEVIRSNARKYIPLNSVEIQEELATFQ